MMYGVEYTKTAVKQLKKMDRKIAAFIVAYTDDKLVNCMNPRSYGKALKGDLNEIWRYRVGKYRILAKIEDDRVVITCHGPHPDQNVMPEKRSQHVPDYHCGIQA